MLVPLVRYNSSSGAGRSPAAKRIFYAIYSPKSVKSFTHVHKTLGVLQ